MPYTEVFFMKTQKIVITALMSALIFVGTYYVKIPLFTGYINCGDAFVLLTAALVNPIIGGVTSPARPAAAAAFPTTFLPLRSAD